MESALHDFISAIICILLTTVFALIQTKTVVVNINNFFCLYKKEEKEVKQRLGFKTWDENKTRDRFPVKPEEITKPGVLWDMNRGTASSDKLYCGYSVLSPEV